MKGNCSLKNIFYLQSNIGINYFFCGHLTSIFHEYFLTHNTKSGWTRQIITILLEEFLRLWETHNKKKAYSETIQQQQHFKKEKLLLDLKSLYKDKDKVMFQDIKLFHSSAKEHIRPLKSTQQINNWINIIRLIVIKSKETFQKAITSNVISKFFHPLVEETATNIENDKNDSNRDCS